MLSNKNLVSFLDNGYLPPPIFGIVGTYLGKGDRRAHANTKQESPTISTRARSPSQSRQDIGPVRVEYDIEQNED